MSKYEFNQDILDDLKGAPKNIVELSVASATRNLKLSQYLVLGSHSQTYD